MSGQGNDQKLKQANVGIKSEDLKNALSKDKVSAEVKNVKQQKDEDEENEENEEEEEEEEDDDEDDDEDDEDDPDAKLFKQAQREKKARAQVKQQQIKIEESKQQTNKDYEEEKQSKNRELIQAEQQRELATQNVTSQVSEDSDDDEDDDDLDSKQMNCPNTIAAQYEKVQRTKQKYRCQFKDVILHVNGKDYVLRKLQADIDY